MSFTRTTGRASAFAREHYRPGRYSRIARIGSRLAGVILAVAVVACLVLMSHLDEIARVTP